MDQSNDSHGRNGLLATYIQFQACVPQENRSYGPVLQRPLSVPPQRKHGHPLLEPSVDSVGKEALEIIGGLRAMGRGAAGTPSLADPGPSARIGQRKLLHEEIALLWAMSNSSSRDVVFSNSWYKTSMLLALLL